MIQPLGKAVDGKAVCRGWHLPLFPTNRLCDLNGREILGRGFCQNGIGTRGLFNTELGRLAKREIKQPRPCYDNKNEESDCHFAKNTHVMRDTAGRTYAQQASGDLVLEASLRIVRNV